MAIATKEIRGKEESEVANAIATLKMANGGFQNPDDAAHLLYSASQGDKSGDLTSIGRLSESDFPPRVRAAITVAKLNVSKNEAAHPGTLDWMAMQIVFQDAYSNDHIIREEALSFIIENKQTAEDTLQAIAGNDTGLAGKLSIDEIKKRQIEEKTARDFLLNFRRGTPCHMRQM